ncbi:MAG: DUF4258 domain-containing protein [Pseudomonadota bacterium]
MNCNQIWFSGHAVERMFDRSIRQDEVTEVVRLGEVIADYPDDEPFPSRLLLGFAHGRPLHVVVAVETKTGSCYIITAYDPDPNIWNEEFKIRRTS